ncbi:hypothetical protein INS49_015403 [Diaporthe citri]|uniref:uncharacterized protein n=1 Tax=Diaporthe citri TaxID=83186 RepID=UPI001C7F6FB5|nr:uncharacterized protein INS49_015403 [Diaporthe citri]KAG6356018.1 hypothetical protein INS49_015403 [Diaporthe citri]
MITSNPSKKPSNTCVTCRARKVRCDGQRDICNNCMRLFTCSYDDSIPTHTNTSLSAAGMNSDGTPASDALTIHAVASHPPRRRVRQACQSCHSRKAKCSGTMPKCDRCRTHSLECVYRPSKRSRLSATPGASSSQHGRDSLIGDGASGMLASGGSGRDDYLSDQSRSASDHLETNGLADLRHLPPPEESLIIRTFEKFFRHVHHIALFSFLHQASLMQRYHSGSMDRPLLLSLIGITSILTDLGPGAPGHPDFTLWAHRPECIDLKLPCNERNFEYDLPEVTESLVPPPRQSDGSLPPLTDKVGFLALHIRIQWIRSKILAFTKTLVLPRTGVLDLKALPRKCEELQDDLNAFEGRLPPQFKWNEANLRLRAYHPRLCVYLMTHIWWEQCHCDLYRIALVGRRESLSKEAISRLDPAFVKYCQRQCFEHAKAMAEMLDMVLQKGVPVSDLDLPVLGYQCANTLYYTLASCGDEYGLSHASVAEMAATCLKVVKQSAPGPAAAAIAEALEKLIESGWVRPTLPSNVTSPVSMTPANHDALAVDPMLQRDALQEADVAHQLYNPSIPQNLPPQIESPGQAMAAEVPQPQAPMQPPTPAVLRDDESIPVAQANMMAGVTPNLSNAFEGALDGSNFGMGGLEPFAMDSSSWYTGDWSNGGLIVQLDEFIDGEIVCTGHPLEDNFEDNLASAAAKMDLVCLANLGLYYSDYTNPSTGTEGNTMIYACTYGAVESCNSIRFFELNPRFDEECPGQGAWMYNETNLASYGRDPAKTVECWT